MYWNVTSEWEWALTGIMFRESSINSHWQSGMPYLSQTRHHRTEIMTAIIIMIALMTYKYEYENNYLCHLTESITITYLQQNVMWYYAKSFLWKQILELYKKRTQALKLKAFANNDFACAAKVHTCMYLYMLYMYYFIAY